MHEPDLRPEPGAELKFGVEIGLGSARALLRTRDQPKARACSKPEFKFVDLDLQTKTFEDFAVTDKPVRKQEELLRMWPFLEQETSKTATCP